MSILHDSAPRRRRSSPVLSAPIPRGVGREGKRLSAPAVERRFFHLADERLSTREAWTRLIGSGSRRAGPDPIAAQVILEGWFSEGDRTEGRAGD